MFTVASVIFPFASTEKAIGRGPARVSATRLPEATSRQLAIDEVLGEAAHAVAAHLSQGAVGVDVVHVAVSLFRESRPHEDDAVGADAEVAVAQIRHLLVGQIKSAVAIVDEDEIVPETVQFGEGQLHGTLLLGGN